ncbi:hypothetical protein EVAR_12951_1 [Eumeta japonica]|uniref:Uncharacterized protein n=1 Tax=Eumeta variegata TaxID=151549 RepID=A0A4C1TVX7_EUMVA|nr:hypothetical protein EVAR_12951_1 [Eumeta japonica]
MSQRLSTLPSNQEALASNLTIGLSTNRIINQIPVAHKLEPKFKYPKPASLREMIDECRCNKRGKCAKKNRTTCRSAVSAKLSGKYAPLAMIPDNGAVMISGGLRTHHHIILYRCHAVSTLPRRQN